MQFGADQTLVHIAQEVPMLLEIYGLINTMAQTKLLAIVPNMNCFKTVILKFKTFIYNSNGKIKHNFCMYGGNAPPVGGEVTPRKEFFTIGIFRNQNIKMRKTNG